MAAFFKMVAVALYRTFREEGNFENKNMPKARKPSSVTDSDFGNTEVMAMTFVELPNDEEVLRHLRSALYPQVLSDKLDKQTQTTAGLTSQLES